MVRNDIYGLVGADSFLVLCNSVSDVEIRELRETLVWTMEKNFGKSNCAGR